MFRRTVLPLLALAGILFSVFMIFRGRQKKEVPPILFEPPQSPYEHYVAGEGVIESLDEEIKIGVPFPDLITDVFVETGDSVKQGQPLFKLDTRQLEADYSAAIAQVGVAKTEYEDRNQQFSFYQRLPDKSAVSEQEYAKVCFAKKRSLDALKSAIADANRILTAIKRSTIVAPIAGEILRKNVRPGEFANVNPFDRLPLIVFGSVEKFQIRVNIAEEDSWRVLHNAPGRAFVRGNSAIQIPLKFVQIEPYIVPKELLTGSDRERIDTRVLQVVYEFEKGDFPVYVGQLLDVYLQAKPSRASW